jgi:hypothetical protein
MADVLTHHAPFTSNVNLLGLQPSLEAAFFAASCMCAQYDAHGATIWGATSGADLFPDTGEAYLVRPSAAKPGEDSEIVPVNGVPKSPGEFSPCYRVERIRRKRDR